MPVIVAERLWQFAVITCTFGVNTARVEGLMISLSVLPLAMLLAAAQDTGATLSGVVSNADTHQPVAGLVVVLTSPNRLALTDSVGRYAFGNIPIGTHSLTVRGLGFTTRTLQAMTSRSGALEINIALVPLEMRLPTVVIRRPMADARRAQDNGAAAIDRQRSDTDVRDDPRSTERDLLLSAAGGDITTRPESPDGLHIRGGLSSQVAHLLDGIPVVNPYHSTGMFSAWNPDAIGAVTVLSTMPAPGGAASLSGQVHATTRAPSAILQSRGSLSSTQARLTLDGPVGLPASGFLVGVRRGFAGIGVPLNDASYVRGESFDRVEKIELRVFGGQLRVLDYGSHDAVYTSALAEDTSLMQRSKPRNGFQWSSASTGLGWTRSLARTNVRALAWRANGDVTALWRADIAPMRMRSARRDAGLLLEASRNFSASLLETGVRTDQSSTEYSVNFNSGLASDNRMNARTVTTTAFARYHISVAERLTAVAGASMARFRAAWYAAPQAEVQWRAPHALTLGASFSVQHQFVQSLRNEESVVGNIFPADLFVGAGTARVPVARSYQTVMRIAYEPRRALHVGALLYQRHARDVVLVALGEEEPFSTGALRTGDLVSRGAAVDATLTLPHATLVANGGVQRTLYGIGTERYTPSHGDTHGLDVGVITDPWRGWTFRLSVAGLAGRHATPVKGAFEWEACNLRDRGCEFGGSPRSDVHALGATTLPVYARADAGVSRQWNIGGHGRAGTIAAFGAATNMFGRRNVLTYSRDAQSSAWVPVEMRPFAPLVVGMEWRY